MRSWTKILLAAPVVAGLMGMQPAHADWRGGWGRGGWGWHGGGWRGGWGWHRGWGWAPFAAGALAGAALAAPYYYGGHYGYGACVSYQPMYDAWGNYTGQQAVNMC
ncbi:MAG: hypothetical protein JO110_23310 [Acetobacteraceae bacterium]|nr:hypothetical protein [Acetobacteraceae bacterium]